MMTKIEVILEKTDTPLKYGYEHVFHGYVSALLGNDTYGSIMSKYSYTNICGGIPRKEGIVFSGNPYFLIITNDDTVWKNFVNNVPKKKNIMENMTIQAFRLEDFNTNRRVFYTKPSSPILVSRKYDKYNYLGKEEIEDCENYLIDTIKNKAKEAGFELDPNLKLKIREQKNHVDICYNGIYNKGRNFVLEIIANEATKDFIAINGLGRSHGCGFGTIV